MQLCETAGPVLVRSWNLFHGNTAPPQRQAFLEAMIRRACADAPDIVCLQELPVWSLRCLAGWSGMTVVADVAARPMLGPVPSGAELGRSITAVDNGLFRSAFTGQANAMLISKALRVSDRHHVVLNPPGFRRAQARWLELGTLARIAWGRERRICQVVRVRLPDGASVLTGNLHATSFPPDERLADAEILRAATFLDALAQPGERCVLAGDFNTKASRSWTLAELAKPEWGFSAPGPWIDHVLVRGAASTPVRRWPDEDRRQDGKLLSDHAPVEVTLE